MTPGRCDAAHRRRRRDSPTGAARDDRGGGSGEMRAAGGSRPSAACGRTSLYSLAKPAKVRGEAPRASSARRPPQALGQRAMKALDLALRLRMAHRAEHQPNPLLEQKHAEPRQAARAPAGSTTARHGPSASPRAPHSARSCESRPRAPAPWQRRAAASGRRQTGCGHPARSARDTAAVRAADTRPFASICHELIRRRTDKALQRRRRRRIRPRPPFAAESIGRSCAASRRRPSAASSTASFAPPQPQSARSSPMLLRHRRRRAAGTVMRPPTPIAQHRHRPCRRFPGQPLVARLAADPERPAGRRSPSPSRGAPSPQTGSADRAHRSPARASRLLGADPTRCCHPCAVVGVTYVLSSYTKELPYFDAM